MPTAAPTVPPPQPAKLDVRAGDDAAIEEVKRDVAPEAVLDAIDAGQQAE